MERILQTDNEKSLFPMLSTNGQEIEKFQKVNFARKLLFQVNMGEWKIISKKILQKFENYDNRQATVSNVFKRKKKIPSQVSHCHLTLETKYFNFKFKLAQPKQRSDKLINNSQHLNLKREFFDKLSDGGSFSMKIKQENF